MKVGFRTRTVEEALAAHNIGAEVIDDGFNEPYLQMERDGRYVNLFTAVDEVEVNMHRLVHVEAYGTRSLSDAPWDPKDLTEAYSEVSTLEEFVSLTVANI